MEIKRLVSCKPCDDRSAASIVYLIRPEYGKQKTKLKSLHNYGCKRGGQRLPTPCPQKPQLLLRGDAAARMLPHHFCTSSQFRVLYIRHCGSLYFLVQDLAQVHRPACTHSSFNDTRQFVMPKQAGLLIKHERDLRVACIYNNEEGHKVKPMPYFWRYKRITGLISAACYMLQLCFGHDLVREKGQRTGNLMGAK